MNSIAKGGFGACMGAARLGYVHCPDQVKKSARKTTQEQSQTATLYLDLFRSGKLSATMELTTIREFMLSMDLQQLRKFRASLDITLSRSFGILPDFITAPDLDWELESE